MVASITRGWSTADLLHLTGGEWRVFPQNHHWHTTGICADPSQFQSTHMLLARSGVAGLGPKILEKLYAQSAGIVAENGDDYASLGVPVLQVTDIRETVTNLAKGARAAFAGTLFGVTGSVGKTTTVAMAAHVMAGFGACDHSRTSANSPYGIGWNLASMDRAAKFWVQEMAMTRMAMCSEIAQPDVAIITAIAPAHTGRFGDTANIAALKARIYRGMQPGGLTVINRDMPEYSIFEKAAQEAGLKVVSFGSVEGTDARLITYDGEVVHASIGGQTLQFKLGAPGWHMAMNAVSVLAAACSLGLDVSVGARRLESFQALAGRGQRTNVLFNGKRLQVWDEAYNANPASMGAALQVMQSSDQIAPASRVLILGDMLELGARQQEMHLGLIDKILEAKPDRILFCGPLMEAVADHVLQEVKGRWFPDVAALKRGLKPWINDNDVILLKASNGIHFGQVVALLTKTKLA